ncbi:MAG: hypothetical protein V1716_02550 [Candidatus Uhrbacteria bacterium]
MLQYAVLLGAGAQLIGKYFYAKETLLGRTKPNRVTWLMWSSAGLIASIAAFSDGVRWAALPVFMAGLTAFLIFIASFVNPKAYWKLETFDYICGACSILALILWWVTKEPIVAIIFAVASDGFAATPTIIKSWKFPETEFVKTYMVALFSAATSFFALKTFSFSELAFPIYLIFVNILLIGASYIGHGKKK